MNEKWLPVVGYEGIYEVSNLGRVKSLAREVQRRTVGATRVPERILTSSPMVRGKYPAVMLSRDGGKKFCPVHVLVMAAFVGPRPAAADICHDDGNSNNSALSNLRYGTRTENCADTIKHGRSARGRRHWGSKIDESAVMEIRAMRSTGHPLREIADKYRLSVSGVHSIIRGTSWRWM